MPRRRTAGDAARRRCYGVRGLPTAGWPVQGRSPPLTGGRWLSPLVQHQRRISSVTPCHLLGEVGEFAGLQWGTGMMWLHSPAGRGKAEGEQHVELVKGGHHGVE